MANRSPDLYRRQRALIRNSIVVTSDYELGNGTVTDALIAENGKITAIGTSRPAPEVETADAPECLVPRSEHMDHGRAQEKGGALSFAGYPGRVIPSDGQSRTRGDAFMAVRIGPAEAIESGATTGHGSEHNALTRERAAWSLEALMASRQVHGARTASPAPGAVARPDNSRQFRSAAFPCAKVRRFVSSDGRIEKAVWRPEMKFARIRHMAIAGHLMAPQQIEIAASRERRVRRCVGARFRRSYT